MAHPDDHFRNSDNPDAFKGMYKRENIQLRAKVERLNDQLDDLADQISNMKARKRIDDAAASLRCIEIDRLKDQLAGSETTVAMLQNALDNKK